MKFLYAMCNNLNTTNTSTNYTQVNASGWGWGTEANNQRVVQVPMTFSNIRIGLTSAPGAGKSYVFTLRKNGAATALTVTIADANTSGSDTTHSVSFVAGDTVSLECAPSGTPAATEVMMTLVGETPGSSSMAFLFGQNSGTSASIYADIHSGESSTQFFINSYVPCSGVFHNLTSTWNAAPGSGKSWTLTLAKNGTDTALTHTVSDAATSGSDTTNSVRVAAGDYVSIHLTSSGAVSSTAYSAGLLFTPDVAGQGFLNFLNNNNFSASATNYCWPVQGGAAISAWSATESAFQLFSFPQATITGMYITSTAAPGSGKSVAYTLRNNAANTAVTATMADAATTASVSGVSVNVVNGDKLTLQTVPSGTPTIGAINLAYTYTFADNNNWGPFL